jgi:hypothetical protein
MSDKNKTDLLAAFSVVAKPPAPADARPARTPAARRPRPARQDKSGPVAAPDVRDQEDKRLTLTYRTTRPNWERIKYLAISDGVSVQALFHLSLSREFERRGLPALED